MNCTVCNTENPDGAKFCNNCGAPLNQVEAEQEAAPRQVNETPTQSQATGQAIDGKRLVGLIGFCSAMLAVLLMFILTFFMGGELYVNASGSVSGMLAQLDASACDIFYFFGQGYQEVNDIMAATPNGIYSGYYEICVRLPIIVGTVISALILIAMTLCTVFTSIRFAKYLMGKGAKGLGKWTVTTFLCYLLCASVMLNLQLANMNVTAPSTSPQTVSVVMNGATVTGIVLGAIFIGIYLLLQGAMHAKEYFTKERIGTIACSAAAIVCFSIVAGFFTSLPLALAGAQSGASVSLTVGFLTIPANLVTDATVVPDNGIAALIFAILAQVLSYALIAVCLLLLKQYIHNLFYGEKDSGLVLSVVAFLLAAAYTVFSILTYSAMLDVLNASAIVYQVKFGALIAADLFVLFGVLSAFLTKLFSAPKGSAIALPPVE